MTLFCVENCSYVCSAMKDFERMVLQQLRSIQIILIAFIVIVMAILCSSCSRSSVRFKGTGEIEYQYKGVNGPVLDSSKTS